MWAHPADLREHKGSPEMPLEMVERKSYTRGLISGRLPMHSTPCFVLPTATRKQALALKKFWDLSEEEQVKAVGRLMAEKRGVHWNDLTRAGEYDYREHARAILKLIKG